MHRVKKVPDDVRPMYLPNSMPLFVVANHYLAMAQLGCSGHGNLLRCPPGRSIGVRGNDRPKTRSQCAEARAKRARM